MSLDPVINFGKVTVSTGYNASATSIDLSSGDGAKLPSTFSYNLTWWNSTDYNDPSDDPNVEIVRVTARSTDTLTIVRAQEGTSASTKNTAGEVYKMVLSITKKMVDDIDGHFDGTNTATQFNADIIHLGSRASLVEDLDPNRYILRSTVVDNAITMTVSSNGNPVSGSSFEIFANDVVDDRANTTALRINANKIVGIYEFITLSGGTGAHQDIRFKVNTFDVLNLSTSGNIGMGIITTPLAKLHVNQLSATGAKPVLLLSQLDIDEDMIEFTCTVGVGNGIEAVGAKALTTTHFIKANITGVGTVYIPCGIIA